MWRGFSGGVIGSEALPVASGNSDFGMLVVGISIAPKVTGWGWFFGVRTKGTVGKMGVVCGTVDADASADGLASVGYAAAGSVAEIGGAGRIGSAASIFVATIGWVCKIGWAGMTIPAARQDSALTAAAGGLGLSSCAASAARKPGASE
jgi:hypothetical protein